MPAMVAELFESQLGQQAHVTMLASPGMALRWHLSLIHILHPVFHFKKIFSSLKIPVDRMILILYHIGCLLYTSENLFFAGREIFFQVLDLNERRLSLSGRYHWFC